VVVAQQRTVKAVRGVVVELGAVAVDKAKVVAVTVA
jgi:hypothetical protein